MAWPYNAVVLHIKPLRAAVEADLNDFIPSQPTPLISLLHLQNGQQHLAVSTQSGQQRELMRYRLEKEAWVALDKTIFFMDETHFVESERYRSQQGPNLHRHPITLPRQLRVGQWHHPLQGARVCLAWAGLAQLRHRDAPPVQRRVAALLAAQGRIRRLQWLAEDLGEIALGTPNEPFQWSLIAATVGGQEWLGGVPPALLQCPRHPLPKTDPAQPSATLL